MFGDHTKMSLAPPKAVLCRKSSISAYTPTSVLRTIFLKHDLDYDGLLSCKQLALLFQEDIGLNISQSEACAYLIDKHGNNRIAFNEFNDWIKTGDRLKNVQNEASFAVIQAAIEMFRKYDTDENHAIDKNEFKRLFLDVGGDLAASNIERALEQLDLDGNERISFSEFLHWLNWVASEDFVLPVGK